MIKIFTLILFFYLNLFSQKIIFNQKDIDKINKSPEKNNIFKRYEAYNKLISSTKDLDTNKKLLKINMFYNQIVPEYDKNKYSYDEYWATPKEFLINARGDCEDYVISKYFTLLESGFSKKDLFFNLVKVKNETDYHMVLLYKSNNELLVLDNLSFRILPLYKRTDLIPLVAFNEYGDWIIKNNKLDKKIHIDWGKTNNWQKLLNRVYNLNE